MDIKQFKIDKQVDAYLKDKKITTYTAVQEKVIPLLLKDKQVIVEAPTGTGKTLAFLIPILTNLDPNNKNIQALITVPTRELATQIANVCKEISLFKTDFSYLLLTGGEDISIQNKKIKKQPQIIIGTQERINKVFSFGSFNLTFLKYIVLDEADMMLDFGFIEELKEFIKRSGINKKIVYSLFSATLPLPLQNFIKKSFGGEIINISIAKNDENIKINLIKSFDQEKNEQLFKLLSAPIFNPFFAIIFTRTNEEAEAVYAFLKTKKIRNLACFTTTISARERSKILKNISKMNITYLVTSDVMSRGMDFLGVSHIINYSYPTNLTYYVHRIGRTNRNNISGQIYDIYTEKDEKQLKIIMEKNKFLTFERLKL
ncbi:MAG: DEAD/DEAH box helicase [Mycoplasmataceae bacterium]|nr:DEAD/DEAH box helicase [Mycoplasmataceae bacterium]